MKYINQNVVSTLYFKDFVNDPYIEIINQTDKSSNIYKLVNESNKFGKFSIKFTEISGDYKFKYLNGSEVIEEGLLRIIGDQVNLKSDNLQINLKYE